MKNSRKRTIAVALCTGVISAMIISACGPGPYGFAKYYVPTDAEEPFDKQARDYTYGSVAANPQEFQDQLIAWFGIVEKVTQTQDGRWLVRLTHNKHRERHLCEGEASSSCRVTVHFKSSGGFSAILDIEPKDLVPSLDKVQPGTLMRVFGRVRCRPSEEEEGKTECDFDEQGGVLLEGVYYRQWPARYYVTTRAMSTMRR